MPMNALPTAPSVDGRVLTREALSASLSAPLASIDPKFLYDTLGSKLFEAICELPEYYPTRTEAAIFARHGPAMAHLIGPGRTLIDLGAGNCAKAAALFPLLHPAQYVPIDIAQDFLLEALAGLRQRFPHIEMTGLGQDFSNHLALPQTVREERRLFFYPGSSIGNFTPDQALAFLTRLRAQCLAGGGLLIGIDLIKDQATLNAAYDDALGVTAAFNLNVLRHVNRLLDADFDVRQWQHRGFFNAQASRIEMHLEARTDLTVRWSGGDYQRRFNQGQRIHTENSYKYTQPGAMELLTRAGFEAQGIWLDEAAGFALIYAQAHDAQTTNH
jgi:dimethylhistidine N-methyltransferase